MWSKPWRPPARSPRAVSSTQVAANTLSFAKALGEIADADLSYFDHQIRRREGLKNFFGNSFGNDLFDYEVIWEDLKQILRDDEEINYAG